MCWQRNLFIQRDYIEGICVRLLRESGLYPELVKRLEILGERHQCIRDVYGFNNVIDKNTAINIDDEGFYMNFFNRKVKLSGSIFSEEDRFFDAIDKEGSAAFAPLEHVDAGIVEQGVLKPKKEVRVGAVVESSQVLDDVQRSCLGPVPADIGSSKESVSSEKPPVKVLTSIPTVRASADERQVLTRELDVLSPIEEKQGGYVLVEARKKFVRCGKDLVNMRLDNNIPSGTRELEVRSEKSTASGRENIFMLKTPTSFALGRWYYMMISLPKGMVAPDWVERIYIP